ncbi:MAG: hypothetical protein MI923_01020 [Phycisphaerales bacterium]|nr:hypothetical protein [Phycisphaerales bacterium]
MLRTGVCETPDRPLASSIRTDLYTDSLKKVRKKLCFVKTNRRPERSDYDGPLAKINGRV